MARKAYRVAPAAGRWQVNHEGAARSNHGTTPPAVESVREVALANPTSQLVVYHDDGTIELESN